MDTTTTAPTTPSTPEAAAPPLTWADVVERSRDLGGGAYLATVGADGRPHVAWVALGDRDGSLWFSTFRSSQKGVNLRTTPEVALAWPERADCLMFGRGVPRLVDLGPESDALWDSDVLGYDPTPFFGSKDNPELLFVEVRPTRVSVGSLLAPDDPPRVWTPGS